MTMYSLTITKFDYYDNEKGSYVLYDTNLLHLPLSGLVAVKDNDMTWNCHIESITYLKRIGKYRYVFKVL